jgi:ubiquinone biosynthesis protein
VRALSYTGRIAVMLGWLAGFGVLYLAQRLWLAREGPTPPDRLAHLRGRTLRAMFTRLGATFVKVGQVMSSRPDLLPPGITDELRALQDRMPPFPGHVARATIERELGRPLAELFADFDDTPVAAASVAQVHRARLRDGREVAVKVLRPDVRAKTERDAAILTALGRVAAWHPGLAVSDPEAHIAELCAGVVAQTDLRQELTNNRRLAANFSAVRGVRVPEVVPELSGEHVLTMGFVRGAKLDELPVGDFAELGQRVEQVVFKMCFDDGFVHADLHPGNLLYDLGADDLWLLDVGLCKALGPDVFEQFVDFSRCLAMGTPRDFTDHLRRFHTYIGVIDWDGLEAELGFFVTGFRSQDLAQLELGQLFERLYALARKYRVRPMPEAVLVMVGVVTCEGIGKRLNPRANLFANMTAALMPLLARR